MVLLGIRSQAYIVDVGFHLAPQDMSSCTKGLRREMDRIVFISS